MLKRLNLYWRWARRKINRRYEAIGDNFPGLDRALLMSRRAAF